MNGSLLDLSFKCLGVNAKFWKNICSYQIFNFTLLHRPGKSRKKIKIAILLQFTRPAEESERKLDPKIIIYYKVYEHFFAINNNFWILLYFTLLCRTGKLSRNCYFSIFSWFSWSVKESKIENLLSEYTILYLASPKHLKEKSSKWSIQSKVIAKNS